MISEYEARSLCGWISFPEGVAYQLRQMRYPHFSSAAPHLMGAAEEKDYLIYRAWKDVLGSYPSYHKQEIGDCVSFGSSHVVDLTEAVQIAIDQTAETWKETSSEAMYGVAREIANMLGGQDGCYGAAAARAVTEVGVVPREVVGAYSGERAKEYGRSGTPAEIKKVMGEHKIATTSMVSTLEEADAALANGYVFIVCSDQGFAMQRDEEGFCRPEGSWSHCMCCIGKRVTGRTGYLIAQSWGPNVPSGPTPLDMPDFSFWIEPNVLSRMIGQRDSFVFSKFNGYPGRPLPSHWTYFLAI